jgi:hypothetical protein
MNLITLNKKCRETLVYDNYIYRDAGKSTINDGVTGTLNIGNVKNGVRVFKNTFINIASKGTFLFFHGPADRELEFMTHSIISGVITNTSMQPGSTYYTNYEGFLRRLITIKLKFLE